MVVDDVTLTLERLRLTSASTPDTTPWTAGEFAATAAKTAHPQDTVPSDKFSNMPLRGEIGATLANATRWTAVQLSSFSIWPRPHPKGTQYIGGKNPTWPVTGRKWI